MISKPQITCIEEGWDIYFPANPVPAARPKFSRWNTYYPKTYANWKAWAEQGLAQVITSFQPTDEPVYTFVEIVKARPKTSKLTTPGGDVDNYIKAPFDAITKSGKIWIDDKQVQTVWAGKRFALGEETPFVLVRAALTLGALWEARPRSFQEDVYDLPWFMREARNNL